jgi:hypothetical protein
VLLETQLAPFRALALERFPGQQEGEALARLATQDVGQPHDSTELSVK